MSIIVTPETKVLVSGITGEFGGRHTKLSLDYGTKIVAGVTPGKGGLFFEHGAHRVPIFNTVSEAVSATGATASAVFVPPPFAADSILESIDNNLVLCVAITEGIPIRDMVEVKRYITAGFPNLDVQAYRAEVQADNRIHFLTIADARREPKG